MDNRLEPLLPLIDLTSGVYRRFLTLGHTSDEATRLAELLIRASMTMGLRLPVPTPAPAPAPTPPPTPKPEEGAG